jgi:two-component system cell cycle response regulator
MAAQILIIEDKAPNLELMAYLLRAGGYAILEARDGEQGLRVAVAERPDLIICDLQMPKLSGYQFVARAKTIDELKGIPLIAVTAFAMVGDREKTLAAGFDAYLSKPIEPETFVRDVEKLLPMPLRAQIAAPPASALVRVPEKVPTTGPTILVVDNVEANLELAVSLLESLGYGVLTARGAQEALRVARTALPGLVISDVCMEEGSGYDLLRELKGDPVLSTIPVMFLSSTFTNERDRCKALALGAARYVFRPLDPDRFLTAVNECLAQARGR